jgi:DNA-binding transcriptional MocR family regulator
MIFHSFSSSLSIQDELVESSSDSCNILPETVTWPTNLIGTEKLGYVGLLKLLTQATLPIQACPSSEDSDLVEREHEGAVGATNIDLSH